MKKKIYIYRIYFPTSDKCYIGQINNLRRRMSQHIDADSPVGRAFAKYDDWQLSILHTARDRDVANTLEIEEIRNFDSVAPNGYNLTHGGGGSLEPSEEIRQRLSDSRKGEKNHNYGKKLSEETRKKIGDANKNPSDETRKKMGDAHKGKKHTNKSRRKMSESRTGENNPMCGRNHSEESRKKMSDSKSGKNHPLYGKHHSEETRRKISESNKGKIFSKESCQKMSEAAKKAWAVRKLKKLRTQVENLE